MSQSDIVDTIIQQLRIRDKHGGYFHQEPYKGDFFRLFVEAADEGDGLKAQSILEALLRQQRVHL